VTDICLVLARLDFDASVNAIVAQKSICNPGFLGIFHDDNRIRSVRRKSQARIFITFVCRRQLPFNLFLDKRTLRYSQKRFFVV